MDNGCRFYYSLQMSKQGWPYRRVWTVRLIIEAVGKYDGVDFSTMWKHIAEHVGVEQAQKMRDRFEADFAKKGDDVGLASFEPNKFTCIYFDDFPLR